MVKAFDLANIVMHIMFISAFLGIYFFTVGSYLEHIVLKSQIDYLVDDLLGTTQIIAQDIIKDLKNTINSLDINNVNKSTKIINNLSDSIEYKLNNINLPDNDKQKLKEKINKIKQSTELSYVDKINDIIKSVNDMPNKINIDNLNVHVNTKADDAVEQQNKIIMTKAFKYIFIGFIVGIILLYVIGKKFDREGLSMEQFFTKLVKRNLLILCFIALTEFTFAFFFAKKYMSINVNALKKSVIDSLIKIKTFQI
jgi:hypothetical protein